MNSIFAHQSIFMKKILPLHFAVYGIVVILSAIILFHFLVIAGIIPSDIVWGGNITDKSELYTMEATSIALNCFMLSIILVYAGIIKVGLNRKLVIGFIWLMFLLFLLNTVGNLLAKNSLETYIFTPLTFILSIFCLRITTAELARTKPVS